MRSRSLTQSQSGIFVETKDGKHGRTYHSMKSASEMYLERSTIQEGPLKGARITLSDEDIIQLMEDYCKQLKTTRISKVTELNQELDLFLSVYPQSSFRGKIMIKRRMKEIKNEIAQLESELTPEPELCPICEEYYCIMHTFKFTSEAGLLYL